MKKFLLLILVCLCLSNNALASSGQNTYQREQELNKRVGNEWYVYNYEERQVEKIGNVIAIFCANPAITKVYDHKIESVIKVLIVQVPSDKYVIDEFKIRYDK